MKNLFIEYRGEAVTGTIDLEGSKSISNRLLLIQALSDNPGLIRHLSPSDDTRALQRILESDEKTGDVGAAGTTMRFLTAYYASRRGEKKLTGSERMKNRPIGILVDALRELGAEIDYLEKDGYPPLHIRGKELEGGPLSIRADVSSQYISALLMCGPLMKKGLTLQLEGKAGSFPYIRMTLELMKSFGVGYHIEGNRITVYPGRYEGRNVLVEGDWSAASYYYGIAALSTGSAIRINKLFAESLQGDSVLPRIYDQLGVETIPHNDHILLSGNGRIVDHFEFDFTNCPDLAQTVVVSCAALGIPARLKGLESLRIKETDRTGALARELSKFGVDFQPDGDFWVLKGRMEEKSGVRIATYEDHRMAMCFAPAAVRRSLVIEDAGVVAKSYPSFWDDLSKLGFSVSSVS
jgi:3-phosphoshikimate 1-carboxyvinyltransferase